MKVGYLGPQGTFSEEAACRYYSHDSVFWHPFPSISDVLDGVLLEVVDSGVVPIENAIEGSIHITIDALLQNQDLHIEGEIILPVTLHLLAQPNTSLSEIREVWSIAPAIAQCRKFLRTLDASIKYVDSTSGAAAAIYESERTDVAVVASRWAAEKYHLECIASKIEDFPCNSTRFLVIGRGVHRPIHPQKTTLVVLPNNEHAGVLASILNVFAALHLNLTWIESRPTGRKLGAYQFSMDVGAGIHDVRMKKVLLILEAFGHDVRVLGSYSTRN